jgi:hypothetical protein
MPWNACTAGYSSGHTKGAARVGQEVWSGVAVSHLTAQPATLTDGGSHLAHLFQCWLRFISSINICLLLTISSQGKSRMLVSHFDQLLNFFKHTIVHLCQPRIVDVLHWHAIVASIRVLLEEKWLSLSYKYLPFLPRLYWAIWRLLTARTVPYGRRLAPIRQRVRTILNGLSDIWIRFIK